MSFAERLERLYKDIPGCRSVVFGDLATGTVLRSAADDGLRQEDHDSLFAQAVGYLGPAAAGFFDTALDRPAECDVGAGAESEEGVKRGSLVSAFLFGAGASEEPHSAGEIRVFCRADGEAVEAVCLRLAAATDLETAVVAVRRLLDEHD